MLVLSFNIRYPCPLDGPDAWEQRRGRLAALVQALDPDLAGFQEVTPAQRRFLEEMLPDYQFFGRGRETAGDGEQACVAVRRELEVLDSGTFWLSQTPELPGSIGWDAQLPRICTRVRLREIALYNVHLDHAGPHSRLHAARLLLERIQAEGVPSVLLGDFNEQPAEPALALLQTRLADALAGSRCGTYHAFLGGAEGPRIDFILLSPGLRAVAGWIVHHQVEGRFPSDHHPVAARIRQT